MMNNLRKKNLANNKVLITGGLGFIGSTLAHKCLALGAKVTIYDCLDPHSGGKMFNIKDIRENITLVLHDILNFDQISQHIINQDLVFNCAASTSHPFSMREPWIDMDVNVRGVINILEAIRRFNPECRFIHIGTSTQLGELQYSPADEKHPEFPTDIYSANKLASEKYVLIYAIAHQLNASVVRLANVYGPRASIHSPEFTFNNFFIGLALQNKPITVYGDGSQKRNILYVDDAVNALISVANNDDLRAEALFAVGDEHFSVAEIAEKTVEFLGRGQVKFIEWPSERKSIDFGDAIISNSKIKSETNWLPEMNFKEGLQLTKQFYLECLDQYI